MNYWLYILPLIAAITGWIINSIAVGIFFRKIIPARQKVIAAKIGKYASDELLSFEGLEAKISSPENMKKIMPMIEDHMEDFLRNRLKNDMPVISMFIGDKTIDSLKKVFMKEIETLFPKVMKQYASGLQTELNLEQVITQKIAGIPKEKMELMLKQELSKEIRSFKILGAITGLTIGIIQLLISLLVG